MLYVGQTVWHVGKNIATKECRVLWFNGSPQSPVLVEVPELDDAIRYRLIPKEHLSDIKPTRRCYQSFALSLTQEIRRERNEHDDSVRHYSRVGSEGAELFWK